MLSSAVAKEIRKNISGLAQYGPAAEYVREILEKESYKSIGKSRYTNDKQITDHYAIIPTGQGLGALKSLSGTAGQVYETIVRRFLAVFYPPAVYQKVALTTQMGTEKFFSSFRDMPGLQTQVAAHGIHLIRLQIDSKLIQIFEVHTPGQLIAGIAKGMDFFFLWGIEA